MKKVLFVFSVLAIAACNNKPVETTDDGRDTVVQIVKEPVVVPSPPPAAAPAPAPTPENTKGTSVKVGNNGVDVQSNDGKSDVKVKVDDNGVEFKSKKK